MPFEPSNESSIFNAARKIQSSDKRKVYLREACGGDTALEQRVAQLLSAYREESQFLEKPAPGLEETMAPHVSSDDLAASLDAGLATAFSVNDAVVLGDANHRVLRSLGNTINEVPRVSLRDSAAEGADPITRPNSPEVPTLDSDSRYRLDGEIARGGMGAIIKGRDTDLGRDLAIKVLLDSHKDKPQVIQRFIEEAQIGGQLQHPGIAPIYELGQFADKRPFFAMKLVKGETLAKLLDDREDAADERGKLIGIFEQICQTMAYAHSRGVIHRDLKPANIMVGAFGEVQVMDWGLAKVLPAGGVADEKKAKAAQPGQSIIQTMRSSGSDVPGSFGSTGSETQMGSVMGTPAYMPPEQALGEIDQMNERADVFGLGAILCEILTGKPPYVGDNGTEVYRLASRGKLDDAFARLDRCEADAELISLTRHCLELEPANRPPNAGILAESVSGYLESVETKLRETELAKADAQVRAEELKRRNKLALTAGTAIVATLVIGISVSLWQMNRATNAEVLASLEAKRATAAEISAREEAERATAAEKLTAETLVEVAAERDAKELARKEAEDISTFLTDILQSPDPSLDGREIKVVDMLDRAATKLESELADQPAQRAKLQATLGLTYYAIGLYHQAIALQEQVRDYHLATSGPEDPDTLSAMGNLAISYDEAGRRDEALTLRKEVLTLSRKVLGPEHPHTLAAMLNLTASYNTGDEALQLREELLTLSRKVLGPEHPNTLSAMHNLATFYTGDEALQLGEELLTLRRKVNGPKHPDTFKAMNSLAISYGAAGRRDEALNLSEEVLTLSRQVLGPEHPSTLVAMKNLAISYDDAGRLDEALLLREEQLPLSREVHGLEHRETLAVMNSLACSYYDVGRWDEAIKLQHGLLPLTRKALGLEDRDTLLAMHNLAIFYNADNRQEEALHLREEVLPLMRKVLGPDDPLTRIAMTNLASSCHTADRRDEALKLSEELLPLNRNVLGPEHPDTLATMNNLAIYYNAGGRLDETIKLREELLPLRRKVNGAEHPDTLAVMNSLAASYRDAGRLDEAIQLQEEMLLLTRKVLGPEHPHTLAAMNNLAAYYNNLGFLYEPLGKRDQAIAAWRKAIEIDPNIKTTAPYYLGVLLEQSGKADEAFTAYLMAIRSGAMQVQAKEKIQGILMDSQNLEACLQAVKTKPDLKLAAFTAFASVGRTEEARALLAEVSVTNPIDTQLAMQVAALQTWFGLDVEFTTTRQRMLAWAINTEDSAVAERVAKLACLRPMEDAESQAAVLALATRAVDLGKDDKAFLPWAKLSLGMSEYRNGKWEEAITSLTTAATTAPQGYRATISGTANFYRAMCLFQQDRKAEAQALFATTEKTMRPLPADDDNPLADNAYHDHLILWLACKEAKAQLAETTEE